MRFSRLLWAVASLLGVWACSSDDSGGPPTGVGPIGSGGTGGDAGNLVDCASIETKTISQLSPTELALMCDCMAERLGGYGNEINCGGSVLLIPDNQKQCVDDFLPNQASCGVLAKVAFQCAEDRHACVLTSTACASLNTCN